MEVITVLTGGAGFEDAAEYLPYVSALRRDRIARKRSGSDTLLSLISLEVTRRTGIPRESIRYVHGAFGKPYLDGSTLQFSLSHTKGAVCAVFSDGESGEVGVDIERRDRRVSERIRERILSENEKLLVSSTEDLLRLWVQKEAFLKRLGTGIADDLRGADTTLMQDTEALCCGEYIVGVSGRGAGAAQVKVITLDELLRQFDEKLV